MRVASIPTLADLSMLSYRIAAPMDKSDTTREQLLFDCLGNCRQALALFDSADRLRFANAQCIALFQVKPGADTFASIMRACHGHEQGLLIKYPFARDTALCVRLQ
jgi:hypothetical protein